MEALSQAFFHPAILHISVFPDERIDRGAVTKVVAILEIECELLAGPWIFQGWMLRKRSARDVIEEATWLITQRRCI